MSTPGWYPDPAGAPNRYRYWDGTQWSSDTVDDPRHPAPGPAVPGSGRAGSGRSRIALAVVILVAVLAVVAAVVLTRTVRSALDPYPSSTVSGGDDSSPTPGTSATPTPGGLQACPAGDPSARQNHPTDARVHGGNLSFLAEPTFQSPAVESRFSFAYDVVQQIRFVHQDPGWLAQLAVGQLREAEGFRGDARATAERLVQCTVNGSMYLPYGPARHDTRSEEVTISGERGWLIETEISVDQPDLPFAGDRAVFIVVPDQDDWGFFFGASPLGSSRYGEIVDRALASLQID